MLAIWIFGFVFGSLLGSSLQGPVLRQWHADGILVVVLVILAAIVTKFRPRLRRFCHAMIALLAIFWGFTHHAPTFPTGSHLISIIKRSPGEMSPAIGLTRQGLYGQVMLDFSRDTAVARVWNARSPVQTRFGLATGHSPICAQHGKSLAFAICRWKTEFLATNRLHPITRMFILGDKQDLSADVKKAFIATGTYHLLVVSGMHVTFIGGLAYAGLAVCLRALYTLRLLTGHAFIKSRYACFLIVACFLFLYVEIIGMNTSSQRAFLLFAAAFPSTRFGLLSRMRFAMALQTWLFPLGWLNAATVMSWTAYCLVVAARRGARLRSLLMTQWWLTAWGAAIFGNFAGPGLLLNPVLGIVFPLVALCAGIDLVSDWWLAEIILTVFVGTMTNIGSFALENPMTSLCWMDVASPIRFALLVAAVPATLNALSNLSIRDDERRRRRKIDVRHPMARPKRIDCG